MDLRGTPRPNMTESVGVWKCVAGYENFVSVLFFSLHVCTYMVMCVCVCVWSGAEQKRTVISRAGVCTTHREARREEGTGLSSSLMLAKKSQRGPHACARPRNPFV